MNTKISYNKLGFACLLISFGALANYFYHTLVWHHNVPFDKELGKAFDCHETEPGIREEVDAIDGSQPVPAFQTLHNKVQSLVKRYVYALGYCYVQVQHDKDDNVYEFILVDLIDYNLIELDIVYKESENIFAEYFNWPYIDEIERPFSLKKINNYKQFYALKKAIVEKCHLPGISEVDDDISTLELTQKEFIDKQFDRFEEFSLSDNQPLGIKLEISYRDIQGDNRGVYPAGQSHLFCINRT